MGTEMGSLILIAAGNSMNAIDVIRNETFFISRGAV